MCSVMIWCYIGNKVDLTLGEWRVPFGDAGPPSNIMVGEMLNEARGNLTSWLSSYDA